MGKREEGRGKRGVNRNGAFCCVLEQVTKNGDCFSAIAIFVFGIVS